MGVLGSSRQAVRAKRIAVVRVLVKAKARAKVFSQVVTPVGKWTIGPGTAPRNQPSLRP